MIDLKIALWGYAAYLREHPDELWRVARQARHLRFGVPVAILRWLAGQLSTAGGPEDIEIEAAPPGIRVTATVEEMGTLLRGSAVLAVTKVNIDERELRVEVRLTDVRIRLVDERAQSPLAALIRSGALDVSRIANLVAQLPKRPDILVEAMDDRLILDFMRLPLFVVDARLRKIVGIVSTLLSVEAVATDSSHLDVSLRALPRGLAAVLPR
ncbi:MAG TPA: hypothetical protein VIV60_12770 [Polyangiaceae bacterium]